METALVRLDPFLEPLRPYLTPITSNLPPPVQSYALSQLGKCYPRIVEQLSLADPECTKLALSKAIGTGIVGLSAFVKIPQLLKLLASQSAKGVSFSSYLLETSAQLITLAYNVRQQNPISTFGEIAILAVQNVIVSLLVLHFSGRKAAGAVLMAGIAAAVYSLFNPDVVDAEVMKKLQAATIPLSLASKIPQIITVAMEGGTGQLSAFAVFNYLFGSLARVFTTVAEVDDPILLYGYVGAAALNAILALQMLYYWNGSSKAQGKKKKHYGSKQKGNVGGKKRA